MHRDDDGRLRPRRRGPGLVLVFAASLALAAAGIGIAAQAGGPSTAEADTAAAPAPAPATQAPAAPDTSTHAGMDMGGSTHTGGTASTGAAAPATPAAREVPYGTKPLAYTMDGRVKVFRLTAAPVKWRIDDTTTVDAWAYNGTVPGPVIRARVGERIRIVVTNRLPEPTTVHWHGLSLPISQDGVPGISHDPIAPGTSHSYEFDLKAPGLAMYHPHFNTLEQQTKGLYGTLVVDPASGPRTDVTEVFQVLSEMHGKFLINGKSFPSTDAYTVRTGEKVFVRTVNLGEMDHPMHLHGFLFNVVGVDGGAVPPAAQYPRYTQNIAPGEAYDLEFTADEPGAWLFHCHIIGHVTGPNGTDAGMITAFTAK
jgi:manganese oxidase